MPLLPQALRRLAPVRLRDDPRVRAVAVGSGLIPPRTMHTSAEAALLEELAQGCRSVVEIGVYEGSSAVVLVRALDGRATLHLIDPFGHQPGALRAGWAATERATRRVVARAQAAAGARAPRVVWHIERSEETGRAWSGGPVDLVFIDGDHTEKGCALDWELWHGHVAGGGHVVFHDARSALGAPVGIDGVIAVVDRVFRDGGGTAGWEIVREVDRAVVVRHARRGPG
ncbi:MAG TPA: class I SAM-dependent methyltransferase [Solirubrobacteraceae bacterium]